MAMGPVEFVVIRFDGNKFRGEILPELEAIRSKGIVRLIDLLFVMKDRDGKVAVREISDLTGGEGHKFGSLASDLVPMLSQDDVETVARDMPNNSSQALILFEHTWATRLKQAVLNAGGEVVSQGRVPPEVVEQVQQEVAMEKRKAA